MTGVGSVAIVGATSGIARESARLWARRGIGRVVLIGRDRAALDTLAADLAVRGGPGLTVDRIVAELTDVTAIEPAVAQAFTAPLDTALVAHGFLGSQEVGQGDLRHAAQILEVTAVSPALWTEAFARRFEQQGSGRIAVVGSVAGDRGRRTNYIYGSAKALLGTYADGLAHRFAGTGVSVTIVKPGPTDTPMTRDLKAKGARLAPVGAVARLLVDGIESKRPVVYAPGIWRYIMFVIRGVPRPVFDRMSL